MMTLNDLKNWKPKVWQWVLIAVVGVAICVGIGFMLNGMMTDSMKEYEQQQFEASVAENESTDGSIIFKVPEDFTCDSVVVKDENDVPYVIFKLENTRTGLHSMIFGDTSNDFSISLFEYCWSQHFDPAYAYEDVDDGEMEFNGNKCMFRRIKYLVGDTYVYWDLFVLCDPEVGKYALFQTYEDGEDIKYITEILESIRFK